jgi:Lrp/AsnC family transcriptional regulator for asnA, asnC and gidA
MSLEIHIDETDLTIIRALWDGRKPFKEIADKMGLAVNTVRNRVQRMQDSGALQIIGLINPEAVEYHSAAYIGFKIRPSKAQEAIRRIGELKGVVTATVVSGRFDVMAVVMFNKEHSYRRFLDEELSSVDGLLGTETFFVVPGETFQLRYVL